MTAYSRLKWVCRAEGYSSLLLFAVAMPLKYLFDMPEPTRWLGTIHGVAFVLCVAQAMMYGIAHRWTLQKAAITFVLTIVPAGTLFAEKWILGDERA